MPSGRYQARYRGRTVWTAPAPGTFATKTDAERWLARTEIEIHDDDWRDPDLGRRVSPSTPQPGSKKD
ncbi:MAG TPA: hypothetical protein VNO54_04215, partial [Streptosporangiaceae bacterium]|nr:hypothetical protein [Streptosporangiaceae bacterium]